MSEDQVGPEGAMPSDELNHEGRDRLKSKSWQAIQGLLDTKPDLKALYEEMPSPLFTYYLLERWGGLKVYDAFNLEPGSAKVQLELKGASEHYGIYDCGSFLVMAPKNLFSHQRTLKDGIETTQTLSREVYERGWTIELVGFEKFRRASWVEFQLLAEQYGRTIEIVNYSPTIHDMKLFESISRGRALRGVTP
jgi:hypothetical protein